jgi:hypothetical protein
MANFFIAININWHWKPLALGILRPRLINVLSVMSLNEASVRASLARITDVLK